jgi:hypothetical protein
MKRKTLFTVHNAAVCKSGSSFWFCKRAPMTKTEHHERLARISKHRTVSQQMHPPSPTANIEIVILRALKPQADEIVYAKLPKNDYR